MGYSTDFNGRVKIDPPLNWEEIEFLQKFNQTRRMACKQGPYYVDRGGDFGQDDSDGSISNYNQPPVGQPGLWCGWTVSDDGQYIEWDGGEKFYNADAWMQYLIEHFVGHSPLAKSQLSFLQGHDCNGFIEAAGEDVDDRWAIEVSNCNVSVLKGEVTYT